MANGASNTMLAGVPFTTNQQPSLLQLLTGSPSTSTGSDFWSMLFGPSQNNIGSVGGQPITVAGQPPISSLLTSGLDIWSLITGQDRKDLNEAINIADPLLPVQGQAQQQMGRFLTDPGSFLNDPAFKAAENIGAENVARLSGSAGMGSSGNKLADLFKYGTTFGLGFENQKFNQLYQLLTGSPEAAKLEAGAQAGEDKTIGDLISQLFGGGGVGGLLPSLAKMFGWGSDSSGSQGWKSGFDLPGGGDSSGGFDLSSLLNQGGITGGGLDVGGMLGDLADFGG